ncbi:MAG: cation-translocating P-type ATPase [Steroidobacter sp.]
MSEPRVIETGVGQSGAAPVRGLTRDEAAARLSKDGANELPGSGPRGLFKITAQVLTEPMFLLLIAAASIYLMLGDLREAVVLSASMIVVVFITILQERRTEHALARLRDLSSPHALVIRDGVQQRIAGRDVVVGDILLLREGDRVPADGVVLTATALSADESILTGESLPVDKDAASEGDTRNVFSGSLVAHGFGTAQVTATGARTQIGQIGRALKTLAAEPTPLFQEVRRVVRWVAGAAIVLCALIAVTYGSTRNDWLGGILAGITLAMGVLPEEFPLVLTVFLAVGAWRISGAGVLTRRMPAVEAIGSVTVMAVDKTGTLTENRMQLAVVQSNSAAIADLRRGDVTLDAAAVNVLRTAVEASESDAFDPMETALHQAARERISGHAEELGAATLVREYDLTPELLAVTHVWQLPGADALRISVKGAPETVMELCRLSPERRAELMSQVAVHAGQGLRALGVACGSHRGSLPASPRSFQLEWLGLVYLADPLRSGVPAALAECTQAGIRVVMITGDHPGTALAIAAQAGFDVSGGAVTGAELAFFSDDQLRERVTTANIYARCKPEHKLRLVQAFKAHGDVIAMTGDGVNDAPALKAADVGVAMGKRGTDVAREAASIVLLNDDFNSLVTAVRLGRRIRSNLGHAMSYIVSVHIPLAGLGLLPVLLGWPLLFFPVHVLFLEFVIDPACALVFEADREAPDIMRRRPRRPDEPLFGRPLLVRSVSLGLMSLLFTALLYGIALDHLPEASARALAFTGLVVTNLALIFVSRHGRLSLANIHTRPNALYWVISATTMATLAAVVYIPAIASMFRFAPPPATAATVVIASAVALILLVGAFPLGHRGAGNSG